MALEAVDSNEFTELLKTIHLDQNIEYHGKSNSMKNLIGSIILLHVFTINLRQYIGYFLARKDYSPI